MTGSKIIIKTIIDLSAERPDRNVQVKAKRSTNVALRRGGPGGWLTLSFDVDEYRDWVTFQLQQGAP